MKLLTRLLVVLLIVAGLLGPGRDYTAFAAWWLTNSQAPELELSAPAGAVRGLVEIPVGARPDGRVELVAAELDGKEVEPATPLRLDTTTLPDGEHTLLVRAEDRSWRRNPASASLQLRSDNTPPTFDIQSNPPTVAQGHTVVVFIRPSEPADVQATLGGQPLKLYPAGNDFWAVLGIDPDEAPGKRELVIQGRDRVGNAGRSTGQLAIGAFKFTQDSLQVSQALLPLLAPGVRSGEDETLLAYYSKDNGPPLWKGSFIVPVKGPISTEFGEVRSYNGGPFQGHHGGTDFQVGGGVPVLAPARGRVVLREEVKLRGRIMVLDHGGGVYTTYAHLSDWTAEVGQEVQPNQPIAKVGSTGLSTGPHLHWELWVNGKNVNPMEWAEREIP